MKKHLHLWEMAALFALCLTLCLGCLARARFDGLSSQLVRLHVLAEDDSEEEQALKLRVRDAVLEELRPALSGVESAKEAREILVERLEEIASVAQKASEGRSVTVTLTKESYPLRRYGGFALPAGRYESLRVVIGRGEGHNWWCVIFPSLCLPAAESADALEVMAREDALLITESEGYELRFRVLELWGELTALFN